MGYNARVLSVMIASPGDVSEERDCVRDTLHKWNDVNSHSQKAVLLPVGWDTHSAPDLAGRPQSIINDRLLKRCDLVVGIFWTRLGTPTGEHESGTVEEIKEHVSAGKPAMVYFSTRPVVPGSYDNEQFEKVVSFKEWCLSKGIVSSFENIEDFRNKFRDELQLILHDNSFLSDQLSDEQEMVEIEDTRSSQVVVSDEAVELLRSAGESRQAVIMMLATMSGKSISAGGNSFGEKGNRRDIAKWEAAVEELENFGLIKDVGYKREVFEITHLGYEALDQLNLK